MKFEQNAGNGGSGGGAGGVTSGGSELNAGTGTPGQGNDGSVGWAVTGQDSYWWWWRWCWFCW